VPLVNIVDESFIVASPESVRNVLCDPAWWAGWLPGAALTPYDDRGRLGVRWTVSGALSGTAEVWLEEHGDGTIVHVYLRADPPSGVTAGAGPRRVRRMRRGMAARYVFPLKRAMFAAKDLLEADRAPGTARVALGERVVSASEGGRGNRRPHQRDRPAREA
jgi:hypothetical protein